MIVMISEISDEIKYELEKQISGEIRLDLVTRTLYSTDASIYQILPLGVALPRSREDLIAIVNYASKYNIPIIPRGSGSSLAGQTVGPALILDCSRYLNQIEAIDPVEKIVCVQPGVILGQLNLKLKNHGLQFGPDPASEDRATIGGVIGNNSTGAHSIRYGMAGDHLQEIDVVLSNGEVEKFSAISILDAQRRSQEEGLAASLYRTVLKIRTEYPDVIRKHWPRTWRNASGYALNYLIPWSASQPPDWEYSFYPKIKKDEINLSSIMAGSEGTLGVFLRAKLNLVSLPKFKALGLIAFSSIFEAVDAVPGILRKKPAAIELIPKEILERAKTIPSLTSNFPFIGENHEAWLAIEFSGDDHGDISMKVRDLGGEVVILEKFDQQKKFWQVRKAGLGLLMSIVGDAKPVAFIEDVAVPVNCLGDFVRGFQQILTGQGIGGYFYAHASAGCLHIRPILNLKSDVGIKIMTEVSEDVSKLAKSYGGAMSGEHGDGIARSGRLETIYGKEITTAFQTLKNSADPQGILNPGKLVTAYPMDKHLRYGTEYSTNSWDTSLDFHSSDGIRGAIEMCNGQGVCRKPGAGMCPTFQATHEEMHSTRGRANLLRELLAGKILTQGDAEDAVFEALDLCLACKACQAECPSTVDMAKLKYEFMDHYYRHHRRKIRDYIFGFLGEFAGLGLIIKPILNGIMKVNWFKILIEKFVKISRLRSLPELRSIEIENPVPLNIEECAVLLIDPYSKYFEPELVNHAIKLLTMAGCSVEVLSTIGAGRTKLSKGFVNPAIRHAAQLVKEIERIDLAGEKPVIVLEPSEISMLRDDFFSLVPNDQRIENLAKRSFSLEEYLVRPGNTGDYRYQRLNFNQAGVSVLLHGHCYQKAQRPIEDGYPFGVDATKHLLLKSGCLVEIIDSGCCGMAGAFGYETEHYELSIDIGELYLFPAIRTRKAAQIVCAPGASCRSQIDSGTGVKSLHPISLLLKLCEDIN